MIDSDGRTLLLTGRQAGSAPLSMPNARGSIAFDWPTRTRTFSIVMRGRG